jgi:hypothetical protein
MDLLSIVGSVVSGGVTGILGSAITGVMDYKNKQLQYKHELDMEQAARATMEAEWAQRAKVAEIEGQTKVETAELEAFSESIRSDKATYSDGIAFDKIRGGWFYALLMVLVDFLRGIIRPASTILFIVMTFVMYFSLKRKVDLAGVEPTALMDLFNQVVTVTLYLASTTVCWWFGARGLSKK